MGTLSFIPMGGLGEIGKNMALLDYDGQAIMIDARDSCFPDDRHPGVDYIIPDFNLLVENPGWLKGIFLTHGHEDHIGAIPYLLQRLDVPVYGTKLTLGFVKAKLEEFKLPWPARFRGSGSQGQGDPGTFLRSRFIRVTHSIVDGCGLAITTPKGVVLHTGDFKIPTRPPLTAFPSTSTVSPTTAPKACCFSCPIPPMWKGKAIPLSERVVGEEFDKIFPKAKKRIIVACFASNIHRVQQVIDAARKVNRKVCIMGRSMIRNTQVARDLGFMNIPANIFGAARRREGPGSFRSGDHHHRQPEGSP